MRFNEDVHNIDKKKKRREFSSIHPVILASARLLKEKNIIL